MFFLGESIWDNISTTIYGLFLQIDSIIYWIAAQLYEIFNTVAGARLVSAALSQDIINIANLVAGVAALFLVAYTIMLRVINPDAKSGGDTKLLKQIVLSVSLVVLSPFIFDFLYGFQNAVVNNNVIPDIILGDLSSDEATLEEYAALKFNDRYLCDYEEESGDTEAVDRTAVCTVDQMESEDTSACIENYETFDEAKEKCDKILTSTMSEQEALTLKNQQVGNNLAMSVYTSFLYPRNNKDVVIETTGFIAIDEESNPGKDFVHGACRVTGWVTSVLTTPLTFFPVLDGIASLPEAAICYFAKDEMKWSEVIDYTIQSGDFSITLATANPIVDGDMTYVFILSTIAGGFLCYMLFSFTLDLAVRAAKLAFLQMIAPIPLFLSIIPSNNDLLKNWVKKVLATYAEVFVRILCMVIAMYLISNISVVLNTEGIGGIAYVIVVLGIITFARQLPKFFSEVTGLKGDGIKLGIGEKLADAGVFTAGSILGGGLTTATRNTIAGIKEKKGFFNTAKSALAGFGSGAVRAGKAGWGAKSLGDMTTAAGKGASDAVKKREARKNQKDEYNNEMTAYNKFLEENPNATYMEKVQARINAGRIGDVWYKAKKWSGYNANYDALNAKKNTAEKFMKVQADLEEDSSKVLKRDFFNASSSLTYDATSEFIPKKDKAGNILRDARGKIIYELDEYGKRKVVNKKDEINDRDITSAKYSLGVAEENYAALQSKGFSVKTQLKGTGEFEEIRTGRTIEVKSSLKDAAGNYIMMSKPETISKEKMVEEVVEQSFTDIYGNEHKIKTQEEFSSFMNLYKNDIGEVTRKTKTFIAQKNMEDTEELIQIVMGNPNFKYEDFKDAGAKTILSNQKATAVDGSKLYAENPALINEIKTLAIEKTKKTASERNWTSKQLNDAFAEINNNLSSQLNSTNYAQFKKLKDFSEEYGIDISATLNKLERSEKARNKDQNK